LLQPTFRFGADADIALASVMRFAPRWRVRLNELFAGATWRMVAFAAVICLIDAVQDRIEVFTEDPLLVWLPKVVRWFFPSGTLALLLMLSVMAALNLYRKPDVRQSIAVTLAVIAACALGTALKLHRFGRLDREPLLMGGYYYSAISDFVRFYVRYLVIGGLFAASYTMHRRETQRMEALQQTESDRAVLAMQMDEAQLQTLLAQIEPHFLFNTLATVRSLYQSEPAAAASMLDNLSRYLTIALPRMRESESTVGREASMAESYLSIQQIRMGARLTYSIDVSSDLQGAPLPPMMLLTLVENALKHGVGPQPEGGSISITAARKDGQLLLQVADTGRGFAKQLGTGAGLANIRARLAALHGASARLRLGVNSPRGVIATIVLPLADAGAPG